MRMQIVLVIGLVTGALCGCGQNDAVRDPDGGGNLHWGDYIAEYVGAGVKGEISLFADSYGAVDITVIDGAEEYTGTGTMTEEGQLTGAASGALGTISLSGNFGTKAAASSGTINITGAFTVTGAGTHPVKRAADRYRGTYAGWYDGQAVGTGQVSLVVNATGKVAANGGVGTLSGVASSAHGTAHTGMLWDDSGEGTGLRGTIPTGAAGEWQSDLRLKRVVGIVDAFYCYHVSGTMGSGAPAVPSAVWSASGPAFSFTDTPAVGVRD